MKRWNSAKQGEIENPKIDLFLEEVINLSKKYNLSISHEDLQGSFIVEDYADENSNWLRQASDATKN